MIAAPPAMIPTDALEALATLAEYAFVGRVLLSLLPPGFPGRHSPSDLPATWAASHLLGSVALLLEHRWVERFGAAPPQAVFLAPWLFLAIARWITLPGAMVPRHEPLREIPGPAARGLALAAPVIVVAGAFVGGAGSDHDRESALRVADSLALLALAAFGLCAARRAPLGRGVPILALAAILAAAVATSRTQPFPLALCLGAGTVLSIPWMRRGDRRAAALALIAFSGCALLGPREALFGAAGLFALWLHTPGPSRSSIAILSAVLLVACALPGFTRGSPDSSVGAVLSPTAAATVFVVAFALSARRRLVAGREGDREPARAASGSVDPTQPQSAMLRDTVLLCIVPLASRGELASLEALSSALLPLAPLFAIESGLLLVRADRPLTAPAPPERGSPERESSERASSKRGSSEPGSDNVRR